MDAVVVGPAGAYAGTPRAPAGACGARARWSRQEGEGAGLDRGVEGHAAEAEDGGPAERSASHRARGPSPAARQLPDHHPRRRRLLRSAGAVGTCRLHRADDARGHADAHVAADLAGPRNDGGQRHRGRGCLGRHGHAQRRVADRRPAARHGHRGRRPSPPIVPAGRVGSVEGPDEGRPPAAAYAIELPGRRDVQSRRLWHPSCRPHLRHSGIARCDHARCDGGISQAALRPGPQRYCVCGRHHAGRGANARRFEACVLEEGRNAGFTCNGSGASRRAEGLPDRPARVRPDDDGRGGAVDDAAESGLRGADRRQSGARRHDGPAVPPPPRGEGIHIRDRQHLYGKRVRGGLVRVDIGADRRHRGER